MAKQSERPEGHPPQAAWPPRVTFNSDPVTYSGGGVVREEVGENGTPKARGGVRLTRQPTDGDTPREPLAEIPTEGPGVPRRAIPAPEEAETTSTIPPPETVTLGRDGVRHASPTTTDDSPRAEASAAGQSAAPTRRRAAARKGTRR